MLISDHLSKEEVSHLNGQRPRHRLDYVVDRIFLKCLLSHGLLTMWCWPASLWGSVCGEQKESSGPRQTSVIASNTQMSQKWCCMTLEAGSQMLLWLLYGFLSGHLPCFGETTWKNHMGVSWLTADHQACEWLNTPTDRSSPQSLSLPGVTPEISGAEKSHPCYALSEFLTHRSCQR